jgi:hypothetical protein
MCDLNHLKLNSAVFRVLLWRNCDFNPFMGGEWQRFIRTFYELFYAIGW